MARYDDDDDDRPRPKKRSGRKNTAKSQDSGPLLIIGLAGGGICVAALLVFLLVPRSSSSLPAPPGPGMTTPTMSGPAVAGTTPGVPATVQPTAAQNAANQAAYEARLAQERMKSAENQKADLQRQYGMDKVVTVIINGVPGDPVAADKYLNRKLFRASYHDYSEASKRAQDQTNQNKEQVKQQAIVQGHGSTGFGPMFVHYRYQEVKSDLPYPRIIAGTKANGKFIYHAAPVLALDQFATRFDVGANRTIDHGSRTVTIEAQLPNPVPDPDVEEMYLQYGREGVAKIRVNSAKGEADRVTYYLETQTGKLDPKINLAVAGVKAIGTAGDYELFVAPVSDLDAFATRIEYGTIGGTDAANREIIVNAKLPDELPARPTPSELAALRQKEWDAQRNKPSEWDEKPRDGEDFYVWALRVIKSNNSRSSKAALLELKLKEVEEDHLKEVSETLIATLKDSWNVPEHLDAMAIWKGPGTEKAIIGLIGEIRFHRHSKAIIDALGQMGTKESARAITLALGDRSYGDDAARALIEIGPNAEEFVVKFIDSREEGIRSHVYDILEEIGTEKSVSKLRSNANKEKDSFLKDRAKQVIERIKQRAEEAKPADPNNPFATKPKK